MRAGSPRTGSSSTSTPRRSPAQPGIPSRSGRPAVAGRPASANYVPAALCAPHAPSPAQDEWSRSIRTRRHCNERRAPSATRTGSQAYRQTRPLVERKISHFTRRVMGRTPSSMPRHRPHPHRRRAPRRRSQPRPPRHPRPARHPNRMGDHLTARPPRHPPHRRPSTAPTNQDRPHNTGPGPHRPARTALKSHYNRGVLASDRELLADHLEIKALARRFGAGRPLRRRRSAQRATGLHR